MTDTKAGASSEPKSVLRLFEIECSDRDADNYICTKYDESSSRNTYFRCKNNKRYKCSGRAIAINGNLDNVILSVKHNHTSEKKLLDETQFRKTLDKVCEENLSSIATGKDLYLQAKLKLKDKVDEMNIGESRKFGGFLHNRQKRQIPVFPRTIPEFETSIEHEQYKNIYQFAERNNLRFYRGIWNDGFNSNIVFISQMVLDLVNKTFKVLPHHIKFSQLYIISIVFKGRSYPLAFILTQRKNFRAYDPIIRKLKLLIPKVTVTNVMSDYEAATERL